jgi:hypothetical protein
VTGEADLATVEFVTGVEFVAHPVPDAEPIVVDADGSTVIAATGLGMTFGDGGAGKTSFWMDGAMHLGAGESWLGGLLTPTRPLRVGWVENEGPQEEFRRKLERKLEAWPPDRVPADHFHVLKVPWAELDLRYAEHRAGLAAAVGDLNLDLLIIGPLNDLGMEGGGTPDEVRAFHQYLKDVQTLSVRLVSLMVLHHENTAGRVSGAWTGRPDLLVHVTAQGNGKTRVYWQKAKWSSSLHRTTSQLRWVDHEGFELEPEAAPRPERTWDDIESYVLAHGGTNWKDVREAISGEDGYLQRRRDAMLQEGVLINAGRRKSYELWHRDDPLQPPLSSHRAEVRTIAARPDAPSGVEENGARAAVREGNTAPHARTHRHTPDDDGGSGAHPGNERDPAWADVQEYIARMQEASFAAGEGAPLLADVLAAMARDGWAIDGYEQDIEPAADDEDER